MSKRTKMINSRTQASPEKHNSTAKWTTLLRQQFSKPRPIRGTRQNAFPSNRYASSSATTRLHRIKGNVSGFGRIGSWRGEGSMTPKSSQGGGPPPPPPTPLLRCHCHHRTAHRRCAATALPPLLCRRCHRAADAANALLPPSPCCRRHHRSAAAIAAALSPCVPAAHHR